MPDLKSRLRQVRKLNHKTIEAFGESLGVSYNVIVNYELGRAKPSAPFLRHLCSVYGVSLYWLETGEGQPTQTDETLDEICDQLRVVLAGMDPYKVDTIIRLVRMPDKWWQQLSLQKDG